MKRGGTRARVVGLLGGLLFAAAGCAPLDANSADVDDGTSGAGAGGAGCREQSLEVSGDDETEIGVTPAELTALLDRNHSNLFTWASGANTVIRISVGRPRVFSVRSRVNAPAFDGASSALHCTDHVRVEAQLALTTTDEQLAETADVALYAYGAGELRGSFQVADGELGGNYDPKIRAQRCFEHTSFRLLFATNGIHGSMVDTMRAVSCDSTRTAGTLQYGVGHWGSRWKNY